MIIWGLIFGFLGSVMLVRFGITFHGDQAGINSGRHWTKLSLSMEWGQRVGFTLIAIGFALQFIAQFLQ